MEHQATLTYSPYMQVRKPISFETLPIPERRLGRELLENIHQVVHQYAQEIQDNYLQSEIDRYAGIAKGLGSMGAELTKVIIVVGTPFASRHQLGILFEQLDSFTSPSLRNPASHHPTTLR